MEIINGRKIAGKILEEVTIGVARLSYKPKFVDILVGVDPLTQKFVNIKAREALRCGFDFQILQLDEKVSNRELSEEIEKLNTQENICGIIIQLPLPSHLDVSIALNKILPRYDIDCLGYENTQLFYQQTPKYIPPTAGAIFEILKTEILLQPDVKIAIVGDGKLVGKPTAELLKQNGIIPITIDWHTQDPAKLASGVDIIISGTGKPGLIDLSWVKDGAVIIDAGTSEENGSIVGDIDVSMFPNLSKASVTPGGVGPVTVAKLLQNALLSASMR